MAKTPKKLRPGRWVFFDGLDCWRTITVNAWTEEGAWAKAQLLLADRDERRGVEPPVSYTLTLKEVRDRHVYT